MIAYINVTVTNSPDPIVTESVPTATIKVEKTRLFPKK